MDRACYFFSLTVIDCVCATGLPPREDWNATVALTGRPFLCLNAFFSAFSADALGLTVKLTRPGAATSLLPFANTIFAGRHFPFRRTKPFLHFAVLAAKTPNFPFWNVNSQLKVPGSPTDVVNVITPVLVFRVALSAAKVLLGGGGGTTAVVATTGAGGGRVIGLGASPIATVCSTGAVVESVRASFTVIVTV